MKIKHTWLFIISGIFALPLFSQNEEKEEVDTIKTYMLRLGVDVVKPIRTGLEINYQGIELVGDLSLNNRYSIAAEVGNEKTIRQDEQLNYTASGSYLKMGIDYNFYKNWKGMNNALFLGVRLGRSSYKTTINSYSLLANDTYFDMPITTQGYLTGELNGQNATWIEVLFGTKVEVVSNLYVGISIRAHRLLNKTLPNNFGNLYSPGFNKITDDNKFGASLNYTLTYALPFRFKKN